MKVGGCTRVPEKKGKRSKNKRGVQSVLQHRSGVVALPGAHHCLRFNWPFARSSRCVR